MTLTLSLSRAACVCLDLPTLEAALELDVELVGSSW